jgi:hypothetical protein
MENKPAIHRGGSIFTQRRKDIKAQSWNVPCGFAPYLSLREKKYALAMNPRLFSFGDLN